MDENLSDKRGNSTGVQGLYQNQSSLQQQDRENRFASSNKVEGKPPRFNSLGNFNMTDDYKEKALSIVNSHSQHNSQHVGRPIPKAKSKSPGTAISRFGLSYLAQTHKAFKGFNSTDANNNRTEPDVQHHDHMQNSQTTVSQNTVSRPSGTLSPESLDQLFKGEKARNKILQKQVRDLKLQLGTYQEEVSELSHLREQNFEY